MYGLEHLRKAETRRVRVAFLCILGPEVTTWESFGALGIHYTSGWTLWEMENETGAVTSGANDVFDVDTGSMSKMISCYRYTPRKPNIA